MALMARNTGGGGDFIPAPTGLHNAVCVDVVDLGDIETVWEGKSSWKHKCRIVWQIEELMEDGKPFTVMQRFTISLHENSALRPILESWRGRAFNEEELEGFDLEKLVGVPCQVNVVHRKSGDRVYANVATVVPPPKGGPKMTPDWDSYTRVKDREGYSPPPRRVQDPDGPASYPDADDAPPWPEDDSDIPF